MNENIDLTKILKDCPKGTAFYSSVYGKLYYGGMYISSSASKIYFKSANSLSIVDGNPIRITYLRDGRIYNGDGECTLFPSKEQRDWSKFTAPWYKKERFDPKTLMAFDKVLVRLTKDCIWNATFFSHYDKEVSWGCYPCVTTSCKSYDKCIPYNDETKHLLGTSDEAPEYYRYWKD